MDNHSQMLESLAKNSFAHHQETVSAFSSEIPLIIELGIKMYDTLIRGNKILVFGNGGSAADAQHIAAEIVGRFVKERPGLPCIALTTDSSILTAVGNDYGFAHVFARQVNALACDGDLVVGITTSGNSKNIVEAIAAANIKGCFTATLTGKSGGSIAPCSNLCIQIPSENTATIQECHILTGHILCSIIDELFVGQ